MRALKDATTYLVVRNSNTDLFSRIWCICEVTYAKKFGFIPDHTLITGLDTFAARKTSCVDAKSTVRKDKAKILKELLINHDDTEIDEYIDKFRAFGMWEGITVGVHKNDDKNDDIESKKSNDILLTEKTISQMKEKME